MNGKTGITHFLMRHRAQNPVSFHMPGHKGGAIYRENGYGEFLDQMMDCDITEIHGADNLFQAEGIIEETMERYKALYQADESYLLINGSSAGLIAAIMAVVSSGEQIVTARNCHKSIFNGLALAGANPVYAYPETVDCYGISGEISLKEIQRCLALCPEAKAVILPSPNYYGICSDIQGIADFVHDQGKILIVDQAHGAHLTFFDQYMGGEKKSAEQLGADLVINSIHKTLASLTQSAVLNLQSGRVDKYVLEQKLQAIQSTSPSYLLLASLDINADLLETKGRKLIKDWEENLRYFYGEAEKIQGLLVMHHPRLDYTKINFEMSACGIDGLELEKLLREKNIYIELVTGDIVMCMTGIGNRRYDYDVLLEGLREISATHQLIKKPGKAQQMLTIKRLEQRKIPVENQRIPIERAAGRVCACSIIPYPPGIPLICPGEVMDEEVLTYVAELRGKGEKVMGIDDQGRVVVGI